MMNRCRWPGATSPEPQVWCNALPIESLGGADDGGRASWIPASSGAPH